MVPCQSVDWYISCTYQAHRTPIAKVIDGKLRLRRCNYLAVYVHMQASCCITVIAGGGDLACITPSLVGVVCRRGCIVHDMLCWATWFSVIVSIWWTTDTVFLTSRKRKSLTCKVANSVAHRFIWQWTPLRPSASGGCIPLMPPLWIRRSMQLHDVVISLHLAYNLCQNGWMDRVGFGTKHTLLSLAYPTSCNKGCGFPQNKGSFP